MALDPRAKLYLLLLANLLLFFHVDTATEAVMMALFLLPMFPAGRGKSALRFLAIYTVLLGMDLLLIPVAQGFVLNLVSLLSVGIRMMLPCLVTGAYAFTTTTPGELFCALRRMHLPEGPIITIAVVIRYFPTVWEDCRQICNAMVMRGIHVGPRHPAQSLEYVLVPLLMNGNTVAQDLSVAALTKGLGLPGRHTSMTEIALRPADWAYMLLCTLPLGMYLGGVL